MNILRLCVVWVSFMYLCCVTILPKLYVAQATPVLCAEELYLRNKTNNSIGNGRCDHLKNAFILKMKIENWKMFQNQVVWIWEFQQNLNECWCENREG